MKRIDDIIASYRDDMVKDFIDILKIPSVKQEAQENMPFGKGVNDALRTQITFKRTFFTRR